MLSLKRLTFANIVYLFYSNNLFSAEGMPQFNAETFPSQLFWLVITFISLNPQSNILISGRGNIILPPLLKKSLLFKAYTIPTFNLVLDGVKDLKIESINKDTRAKL